MISNQILRPYSEFSPNAGKYGPEKSPYLDSFHAVILRQIVIAYPVLSFSDSRQT